MRVAVDARPAIDAQKTGVGYYTWHLLHELPEVDPETRYLAWYLHAKGLFGSKRFFPEAADHHAWNFAEHASRFPARLFSPIASRLRVPRLEWLAEFDLLFAPNFIPPPTERPFVVTVHDIAFALFPETARHLSPRWHAGFRRGIERAARILVPSVATRADLRERFDVPIERVSVVPLGVDAASVASATGEEVRRARDRLGVDGAYLLFLGGIEGRKNLPGLVRAFASLPADLDVRLVIAGGSVARDPGATRELEGSLRSLPDAVSSRIVRTGYVSDPDKAALLAGAEALVYPSRYEGFGFPVLEAMAAGTPVVTSDRSSLPEVAGDDAVLVDPESSEAIAAGIERVLTDSILRERLAAAGPNRAASFTWERTARETAEVLHSVAAERGR
ncbi:MAG: glycosyltransferase family 4 protein [Actinomycetota bacterium]|nr:glycosyltransferase family 4 protein [Actinomycetota bacterium]